MLSVVFAVVLLVRSIQPIPFHTAPPPTPPVVAPRAAEPFRPPPPVMLLQPDRPLNFLSGGGMVNKRDKNKGGLLSEGGASGKNMEDCMKVWADIGYTKTHMTESQWRRSCKYTLDNPDAQ